MAGNGIPDQLDAFPGDTARTSAIDGISTTVDNQILVELMPEDTTPANLFDLNERTLVFTPDGEGGYSRPGCRDVDHYGPHFLRAWRSAGETRSFPGSAACRWQHQV